MGVTIDELVAAGAANGPVTKPRNLGQEIAEATDLLKRLGIEIVESGDTVILSGIVHLYSTKAEVVNAAGTLYPNREINSNSITVVKRKNLSD